MRSLTLGPIFLGLDADFFLGALAGGAAAAGVVSAISSDVYTFFIEKNNTFTYKIGLNKQY